MSEPRRDRRPLWLFVKVAVLLSCAVGFERGLAAFEATLPRAIYIEPSFTLALLADAPWLLAPLGFTLLPLVWWRSTALGWDAADSIGGLRWIAFGVAVMLAWTHVGHPINDYYGQPHVLDRWLLVALAFGTLRSPLLVALFAFEMTLSRGQLHHPINAMTPIGDELPLRFLGLVVAAAGWNLLLERRVFDRLRARRRELTQSLRIVTPELVFAMLCFIGSYYGYAGIAKLTIGATPLDWMRDVHLENLFIGAYLNGWNWVGSGERALEVAQTIRWLSTPIAAATVIIECGMIFLLVHRNATLLLVVSIAAMHVGIVIMTGIFFWKWLGIDLMLALWLFWARNDAGIRALYRPVNAIASVALIVAIMSVFGLNEFTWWNTRWYSLLDVEVVDAEGRTYRVEPSEFEPYMLMDFMRPEGSKADTFVYGMTFSQGLMERVQHTDARTLQAFLAKRRAENREETHAAERRNASDFLAKYFRNRNRRVAARGPGEDRVFPFMVSAWPLHTRSLLGANRYRDQARVVEARVRHLEIFYSGDALVRLGDEVLDTVEIPHD